MWWCHYLSPSFTEEHVWVSHPCLSPLSDLRSGGWCCCSGVSFLPDWCRCSQKQSLGHGLVKMSGLAPVTAAAETKDLKKLKCSLTCAAGIYTANCLPKGEAAAYGGLPTFASQGSLSLSLSLPQEQSVNKSMFPNSMWKQWHIHLDLVKRTLLQVLMNDAETFWECRGKERQQLISLPWGSRKYIKPLVYHCKKKGVDRSKEFTGGSDDCGVYSGLGLLVYAVTMSLVLSKQWIQWYLLEDLSRKFTVLFYQWTSLANICCN